MVRTWDCITAAQRATNEPYSDVQTLKTSYLDTHKEPCSILSSCIQLQIHLLGLIGKNSANFKTKISNVWFLVLVLLHFC
jgi:hypothetical protein